MRTTLDYLVKIIIFDMFKQALNTILRQINIKLVLQILFSQFLKSKLVLIMSILS